MNVQGEMLVMTLDYAIEAGICRLERCVGSISAHISVHTSGEIFW